MPKRAKPHVHGRDHEHGGADPTKVHYDDVGDSGAGGGSGIQYETVNTGGWLDVETTGHSPSTTTGMLFYATEDIEILADGETFISGGGTSEAVHITTSGVAAGNIGIDATHGSTSLVIVVAAGTGHYLILNGLPTTDPGVSGAVWNDGGTLKIS
jgi:hypothetical protein